MDVCFTFVGVKIDSFVTDQQPQVISFQTDIYQSVVTARARTTHEINY